MSESASKPAERQRERETNDQINKQIMPTETHHTITKVGFVPISYETFRHFETLQPNGHANNPSSLFLEIFENEHFNIKLLFTPTK